MRPAITGDTENGRSIEGDEHLLAAEIVLGDGPGGSDAEHDVERHGDGGGEQRQANGGQRVRRHQRLPVRGPALLQALGEDGEQRQQQKHGKEGERR